MRERICPDFFLAYNPFFAPNARDDLLSARVSHFAHFGTLVQMALARLMPAHPSP